MLIDFKLVVLSEKQCFKYSKWGLPVHESWGVVGIFYISDNFSFLNSKPLRMNDA